MSRAPLWLVFAIGAGACETEESAPAPVPPPPQTQLEKDCAAMCEHGIRLGCEDGTCALRCVQSVTDAPECNDHIAAYVHCLADGFDDCSVLPDRCRDERTAWEMCDGEEGCSAPTCGEPIGDSCNCSAVCSGQSLIEQCEPSAAGGYDCVCIRDGQPAVTCPGLEAACAFFIGCCSEFAH
jgi:hypothetical protein